MKYAKESGDHFGKKCVCCYVNLLHFSETHVNHQSFVLFVAFWDCSWDSGWPRFSFPSIRPIFAGCQSQYS